MHFLVCIFFGDFCPSHLVRYGICFVKSKDDLDYLVFYWVFISFVEISGLNQRVR